jgi:hypothetical protein
MGLKVKVQNICRVKNKALSHVPGYEQFEPIDKDVRKSLITFFE